MMTAENSPEFFREQILMALDKSIQKTMAQLCPMGLEPTGFGLALFFENDEKDCVATHVAVAPGVDEVAFCNRASEQFAASARKEPSKIILPFERQEGNEHD